MVAGYRFGQRLGEGGFGVVREAVRDDGWECVVKQLRRGYGERVFLRFQRGVRIQSKMHHPNVVPVAAVGLAREPPWFIMPRALRNLRQHLQQSYGETELRLFVDAARGVEYAHKNGVIHRDIKPENILLFEDYAGVLYAAVTDFGLGHLVERDFPPLNESDIGLGTMAYVAPEQVADPREADERADIYSLGKVLYEVLTGSPPLSYVDSSEVSGKFVYIIRKCTYDNPEDRYQTVGSLLDDLDLVTTRRGELGKPAETALQAVENLVGGWDLSVAATEGLAGLLRDNTSDEQMLNDVFPRIPQPLLEALIEYHMDAFRVVLEAYDKAVEGRLPFDYCDVVADFYRKIFELTRDYDVRALILRRLPVLGFEHDRWYVGRVFARIVSGLDDEGLIILVRDLLRGKQDVREWCKRWLEGESVPQTIRKVVG